MRHLSLACLLLLAACRQGEETNVADTQAATGEAKSSLVTYAGQGRDRLCLADGSNRAGLITFGEGDANCSVRGTAERSGERLTIVPEGDTTCRIAATISGDRLTLGEQTAACSYYCGPTASYAGKSFTRMPRSEPVTDLAGDPLC